MATKGKLAKNKALDKIYYPENGLVVRSQADKTVIGRIVDKVFVPLNKAIAELCEENDLEYDKSLLKEEKEETEEQEQEEETEEKEDNEAEGSEEEEKPPVVEKVEKKGKASAKPEKVQEKPVEKSSPVSSSTSGSSGVSPLLKQLETLFSTSSERQTELEQQVLTLQKELDEYKKKCVKLSAALRAMQDEL